MAMEDLGVRSLMAWQLKYGSLGGIRPEWTLITNTLLLPLGFEDESKASIARLVVLCTFDFEIYSYNCYCSV